jgi:hypothetical protein
MAKVDKQQLIKHHFWILLGVFAFFILLLVILVPVLIGSEIKEKEAEYAKVASDLESKSKTNVTQFTVDKLTDQTDVLGKRRSEVWRQMYSYQGGLVTFPGELAAKLDKLAFGDDIDDRSRNNYAEVAYEPSYQLISQIVAPTEYVGGWQAVLHPVRWFNGVLPTKDEVWLSLEDLCVRREVLTILHEGNETSARMKQVENAKDLPQSPMGEKFARRWANALYQIDLVLTDSGRGTYTFSGKIKNVSGRRQRIYELFLNVLLNKPLNVESVEQPVLVRFPISDIAAGQTIDLPPFKTTLNLRPEEMYSVKLFHTIKTVPIKQIEAIELGINAGHRMADKTLQRPAFIKQEEQPASGGPMGPGMGGGGPGEVGAAGAGGKVPMFGGAGGANANGDERTATGILKNRYITVTPQVRRMPVAIWLTVDQAYIPDILAAFSNFGTMRFQITHYHWKRHHGPLAGAKEQTDDEGGGNAGERDQPKGGAPMGPNAAGEGGGRPPVGMGGFGPGGPGGMGAGGPGAGAPAPGGAGMGPGGIGPMGPGMGPGRFGPGGFQPGQINQRLSGEQPSESLVELTIYGVANLYERPKDVPVTTPTPSQPPAAPEAAKPGEPAKPAEGTAPKTPEAAKPGEAPKNDASKPAAAAPKPEAPKPSDATKPDATKPAPAKPGDAAPAKPADSTPDKPKTPEPGKPSAGDKDKPKDDAKPKDDKNKDKPGA